MRGGGGGGGLVAMFWAAGGGGESIVALGGRLPAIADFPVYDSLYREIIGVTPKPARTTVRIAVFVSPNLVEVDAIAIRTPSPTHS